MGATVSVHRKGDQFAGFKKMIGGQRFYFGESWGINADKAADRKKATKAAELLEREYAALKLSEGGWNDQNRPAALNRVRNLLGFAEALTPTQKPPKAEEPARMKLGASGDHLSGSVDLASLSMTETIKAYKAAQDERFATKKISEVHLRSMKDRLDKAMTALPSSEAPLSSMRRPEVEALVNHWLKRPKSERTGEPISPASVGHFLQALGHFFRWCYDNERWDGFRAWETLFNADTSSLMTPEERHLSKKGKPKFTVDELAILYAEATSRTRLYILLGLNCGMGQTEQSTLRSWDVLLDNKPPLIDRNRNKTQVQGRWELWTETADALKRATNPYNAWAEAIANKSPEYKRPLANKNESVNFNEWASLALRTEDGYPLVHGKTDAIQLAWARLFKKEAVKKAVAEGKLRKLPFYTLRRTAAQFVRELAGYETHKVFLAHASLEANGRQSISEKHYTQRTNADFAKVADATRKLRSMLQPMFAAAMKNSSRKESNAA
jgi:integrase